MIVPKHGGASSLRHVENIFMSQDVGWNMNYSIKEWDKIRDSFVNMFHGLGEVETSKHVLRFTSIEPHVSTGISLTRQGKMVANMPLHNLDSTFNQVSFEGSLESLTLTGNGFRYTYRIPDEILAIRIQP